MLSVIIPVYNVADYLREALDSICNQTYRDLEIIIVNDGSTDRSPEICREYAQKDARIRVIDQPNSGQGAARNKGLELANGDYIGFFDSDDVMHPETFRHCIEVLEKEKAQIVRFSYRQFSGPAPAPAEYDVPEVYDVYTDPKDIRQMALCIFSRPIGNERRDINLGAGVWSAVYDASFLKGCNVSFPPSKSVMSEDFIYTFKILQHNPKVVKITRPYYQYRYRPGSTTKSGGVKRAKEYLETSEYIEKLILETGYPAEDILYAQGYAVELLRAHLKNIIFADIPKSEKKQMLHEIAQNPILRKIYDEYPWRKTPFKHRILFKAMAEDNYTLLNALYRINKLLKG